MRKKSISRLKTTTMMTAVCLVYPQISQAQTSTDSTAQKADEIVVSASRIERIGFTAPTPTTVVGAQQFQDRAAITLADVLDQLPSVRPAGPQIGVSAAGVNTVNLRALGPNRTLFLVDGRRVVSNNRTGTVDSNVVPSSLIARTEIVSGGASAAWGSDAVAGVVNVVLKKKLEGFSGNVQYGQSQRNDNKSHSVSLAWGTDYADGRGQFMIAGEYSNLYDVAKTGDRDWGRNRTGIVTKNIDGLIYTNVPVQGLSLVNYTTGGVLTGASTTLTGSSSVPTTVNATPNTSIVFGPGGVIQKLTRSDDPAVLVGGVLQSGTSSTNYAVGGYGTWIADRIPLNATNKRGTVFARTTFDISSNVQAFAEASFNTTENRSDLTSDAYGVGSFTNQSLSVNILTLDARATNGVYNNPFVGAEVAKGLVLPANIQTITLSRLNDDLGLPVVHNESTVERGAFGLTGEFGESGRWKSYYTHGKSVTHVQTYNNPIQLRLQAALNVTGTLANPVCNTAGTAYNNPTMTALDRSSCVAANPFGPNSFTQAVKDYVTGTTDERITAKQDAAGLSIQGDPFSVWAGPVSVAGGLEWRKESLGDAVDPRSDQLSTVGDYGIPISGGYASANPKSFFGKYSVKELFGEAIIPVLRSLPFAQSLDLNSAARRTIYSTSGGVTSWKMGLTYEPVKGLLVRGTRSRDIRAASLAELYTAQNASAANFAGTSPTTSDPLYNAGAYNYIAIGSGNPALVPERALTKVFGVSWSPEQIKGFSTSLDYFNIDLQGNITTYGATNIIDGCGNGVTGANTFAGRPSDPSFCARIDRGRGYGVLVNQPILTVNNSNVNAGTRLVQGFDVEFAYRLRLADLSPGLPGNVNLRALGTRYDKDISVNAFGVVGDNQIGLGANPRFRWTLSSNYQNGPLSVTLQGLYTSQTVRARLDPAPSATSSTTGAFYYEGNKLDRIWQFNASGQYTIYDKGANGRLVLFGYINNLFDSDPQRTYPDSTAGPNAVNPNQGLGGDLIGRAFVLGLRFNY